MTLALGKKAQELAARINKEIGEGAAVLASEMVVPQRFTSGSLSLDITLGGGWPANKWVEVYGTEGHGKTAIVLKTIAAQQRLDKKFETLWIAAEPYDTDQAEALGVDNHRILLVETQDMVLAYDTVIDALNERAVDAAVVDSYPALIAPEENAKYMDGFTVSEGARMNAKFFRKVGKAGHRAPGERPFMGIFVNQLRDAIGVWSPVGTATTTPGGKAKNYAFYVRLEVKRTEYRKEGKTEVGQVIKARTVKNKGGPPQRVALIDFYFADAPSLGFKRGDYDLVKDTIVMGILYDVIEQKGRYFSYSGNRWGSKDEMLDAIRTSDGLYNALRKETLEASMRPEDKRMWDEEDVDVVA